MIWKALQLAVFAAVMISDAVYDWGHGTSKLAVAAVALFAAWIATALPAAIIDQVRRLGPQHRRQGAEGLRESCADGPLLDRVTELRDGSSGGSLPGSGRT